MTRRLFVCSMTALGLALGCAGCSMGRTAGSVAYAGKTFMLYSDPGPTPGQSKKEHMHSIHGVIDHDSRAFFHDLDLFFQTERPTRLTPWHDR